MGRYNRKIVDPILPWKNIFIIKHFEVNWSAISTKNSIQKITPLFRMFTLSYEDQSTLTVKNKIPVILNSNYWKNATRSKQVNIHRAVILTTLSTYILRYSPTTLINIYLLPTSVLVPSQQIAKQIQYLFKQKIIYFQNFSRTTKQSREGVSQFENRLECFQYLFPFKYNTWMQYMTKHAFMKDFMHILIAVNNVNTKIGSRGHWLMAHHYVIYFSKDLHNLRNDMANFLKLIKKFNFFEYLAIGQVHDYSWKLFLALCMKFVRCLKWSSKESEDYLIFLLKTHHHQDIIKILQDFQKIYTAYQKWKHNKNKLPSSSK